MYLCTSPPLGFFLSRSIMRRGEVNAKMSESGAIICSSCGQPDVLGQSSVIRSRRRLFRLDHEADGDTFIVK